MYQPVMSSVRSRYGNNRWIVDSTKLGRTVQLNSDLEYYYWILIESDPQVARYCEQPLRITVREGNREYGSVFDFWEEYRNGFQRFVEVKYAEEIDPESPRRLERSIRQIRLQREWCAVHGFNYAVVTDAEIFHNVVLLQNKKRIVSLARDMVSVSARNRVRSQLSTQPMSIRGLMDRIPGLSALEAMTIVAQLLCRGEAEGDLARREFGLDTDIWLPCANGPKDCYPDGGRLTP